MLKNYKIKNYNIFFILIALAFVSSCDKAPGLIRKATNEGQRLYYQEDAKKYDIESAYNAGKHNCCGPDTLNDDVKSLNYYCKAALANHKTSQVRVAEYFANRTSKPETIIPLDLPLAYAYASIASDNGSLDGASLRASIAKQMKGSQLSEASSLISAFPDLPCEITR